MIRPRDPEAKPPQALTKPELYLAGMRFAGSRPPTEAERLALMLLGYGSAGLSTVCALLLGEIVRNPFPWLASLTHGLIVVALGWIGIYAGVLAGPVLRALRRNRVSVYRGPVFRLGHFDANQDALFKHRKFPEEMIVLGDGRIVLRAGKRYLPHLGRLLPPVPVSRERGPDTRSLTEDEREELRALIRRFSRPCSGAFLPPVLLSLLALALVLAPLTSGGLFGLVALMLFFIPSASFVHRLASWTDFAKTLRQDLEDGVMTSGNLWSGFPWLVNGEPAPWRTLRPDVGLQPLNLEQLRTLPGPKRETGAQREKPL